MRVMSTVDEHSGEESSNSSGEESNESVLPLDSALGKALCATSTSNQWSLLEGLVSKVNKRLRVENKVSVQALALLLQSVDEASLGSRGVWYQGTGQQLLVCINPPFGRARMKEQANGQTTACSCRVSAQPDRYLTSSDYNAGRHACTASRHIGTCPLWRPASSGHLHSWRRGYTTKTKKRKPAKTTKKSE